MVFQHEPVLLQEVISGLNLKSNGVYVDCTLGGAGHSYAILQAEPNCTLIGIDQDPSALAAAQKRLAPYKNQVKIVRNNFRNLDTILDDLGFQQVDGILMDIGVSSWQLDAGERGFSFHQDALLDMRMDPDNPVTAQQLVNNLSAEELTRIIGEYGEERWAKRIAEFIVAARVDKPIQTTGELVSIIKAAIPKKVREAGPHPARRTFQALRIAVNDELQALEDTLDKAVQALKPGGRLCVITFHSLEDRITKNVFRKLSGFECSCPPGLPICVCEKQPIIKLVNRKPILPSAEEIDRNPRSRSAKLRICERLPKEVSEDGGSSEA
ncbi:MAG: 16S rRNA (cytosine(1402)-N(4))-methyltransferase RsmH [Firmicutes bacterium]|nr:16S rRNA (cytosine(1402)-N(4))-methyltransferase RsmH [Bacillota bacterium]